MSAAVGTRPMPDIHAELTASCRPGASRYFFVGLGALCILIVVVGFAPNLYKAFSGDIVIPPIVYVHAAIMMGWVVLYTAQAGFAAHGNLRTHRRTGWAATVVAAAVWISMGVATIMALQRFDPDKLPSLVKPLLIQLGTMAVFPVFIAWAVLARRRAGWHKRLMTFATFALVQAALDRMHWLPNEGLPMFWHYGLRLYVLLMLPLFVFDIVTLRRIHPATLVGSGLIVAMHGVVSFYWADEGWNQLARGFWMWLR
jgi:hypothetical protein